MANNLAQHMVEAHDTPQELTGKLSTLGLILLHDGAHSVLGEYLGEWLPDEASSTHIRTGRG